MVYSGSSSYSRPATIDRGSRFFRANKFIVPIACASWFKLNRDILLHISILRTWYIDNSYHLSCSSNQSNTLKMSLLKYPASRHAEPDDDKSMMPLYLLTITPLAPSLTLASCAGFSRLAIVSTQ